MNTMKDFTILVFMICALTVHLGQSESCQEDEESGHCIKKDQLVYPESIVSVDKSSHAFHHFANLMHEIDWLAKQADEVTQHSTYPEVKFLHDGQRKRILVSGGAGLIGSHLVDKLMLMGHEVTVVDNFLTGTKQNYKQWIGHENFEALHHDITKPLYIEVDEIYHLVSLEMHKDCRENPIQAVKTSIFGTMNILGMAKRSKARLLFASSSEIYGEPEQAVQSEEEWGYVNPIGPKACYQQSKRTAESICYNYKEQERIDAKIARIFPTFGPRMHLSNGTLLSSIITGVLQNKIIEADGDARISLSYVTDIVDGLIALMGSKMTEPCNLGNPHYHTVKDIFNIVKDFTGGESELIDKTDKAKKDVNNLPDISRAISNLNWHPKTDIKVGLRKTINFFKANFVHWA